MESEDSEKPQHTYIPNFIADVLNIAQKRAIKFDENCILEFDLKTSLPTTA